MPLHLVHAMEDAGYIQASNWFYCLNELNEPVSQGYIIDTESHLLYPKRPLNIYMYMQNMKGTGPVLGRDLLLGAILARSYSICLSKPNLPARLFAKVNADDTETIKYYQSAGFNVNNSFSELCEIQIPEAQSSRALGVVCAETPIWMNGTVDEIKLNKLMARFQTTQRVPFDGNQFRAFVERKLFWPFYVSGIWGNTEKDKAPFGELLFTGDGKGNALLRGLYFTKNRHGGIEQALLAHAMNTLRNHYGVVKFYAYRQTNISCDPEMNSTSAKVIKTECCYPERLYG